MRTGKGIIDEYALNVFTDGSSFPKKQRAAGVGVCIVWVNENGDEESEEYAPPGWQQATIDEMEIEACIVGLQEAKRFLTQKNDFKRILVFSDSKYVVDNFFKAMHIWPKKKWLGANGMPVENIDLWKRLRKEVSKCPLKVEMEWVKGHKGHKYNRAADKLARQSAEIPFNKPLSHGETTKRWSNRSTRRGCIPVMGQELKIKIVSREYKKKAKVYEYRYEVIDPTDRSFKDLDFVYYDEYLSRNKCIKVRLNNEQRKPFIIEVIEELEYSEYKY